MHETHIGMVAFFILENDKALKRHLHESLILSKGHDKQKLTKENEIKNVTWIQILSYFIDS